MGKRGEMAFSRVSTGIKDLDTLLGGGYKKNSVNIVTGEAGTGKTIFSAQFLLRGLLEGEAGLYITFEEKREKFYEDMIIVMRE